MAMWPKPFTRVGGAIGIPHFKACQSIRVCNKNNNNYNNNNQHNYTTLTNNYKSDHI